MSATLAIDLGGTHMRCAVVSSDGHVRDRDERPTPHDAGPGALINMMQVVSGRNACDRCVVGVPGRVDYRSGRLEHAPNLGPGWVAGLNEADLSSAVGIPVAVANDADLAAVGEAAHGAGREYSDVAYLTVSTGIGAGVVLGGLLVHGRRSLAEIGHTVIDADRLAAGRPATLEELGSGTALGRSAVAAGIGTVGADVVAAVRRGDRRATVAWAELVAVLAVGVTNLAWLFSPEVIVIGGGLGLVGDVLLSPLRTAVITDGPPAIDPGISIVAAALGDDAGLVGAAGWHRAFVPEAAGRPVDRASGQAAGGGPE
ncbi:MAG: ROK family protein [Acidimicrobiales bacterium]